MSQLDRIAIFLMGISCSGKSTLLQAAQTEDDLRRIEGLDPVFGVIEVGKTLRERYPPEHFKGEGAPAHTQEEALDIFRTRMDAFTHLPIVLVDGQPRNTDQIEAVVNHTTAKCHRTPLLLVLHASEEILFKRADLRDTEDEEATQLAHTRIKGDATFLYPVLTCLSAIHDIPAVIIDAESPTFTAQALKQIHLFRQTNLQST